MTTIAERTKALVELSGLNEYSFSKRIGKSNTAITKIVKGESKPGYDMLESIFHEFPNLSREWFLEGTGEMWKSAETDNSQNKGNFGSDVADRILEEFRELKVQLSIKDKQIDGMQRTIDALLGTAGAVKRAKSFRKPVAETGRILELYPAEQQTAQKVA